MTRDAQDHDFAVGVVAQHRPLLTVETQANPPGFVRLTANGSSRIKQEDPSNPLSLALSGVGMGGVPELVVIQVLDRL